ncbi:MAG: hypothetical protein HKN47_24500, partial [Pirellulaceae bacterium]|nr:hypothetical protein [Pirellulaceae bacterium]
LGKRIKSVEKLRSDLNRAESRLLVRYHRDDAIDVDATRATIDRLKDRLWDMMCELHSNRPMANQRITLILLGPNLQLAKPLLEGYRALADMREWDLQTHAILPRDGRTDQDQDRVVDTDGWSRDPSFRIGTSTTLEDLSSILTPELELDDLLSLDVKATNVLTYDDQTAPKLAAYRLIRPSELSSPPPETLGLMLTFSGRGAEAMLLGEVGVHSIKQGDKKGSRAQSWLISKHLGTPIQYTAPSWLPNREYQLSGNPRRGYDLQNKVVLDLAGKTTRTVKMDRAGKWLEAELQLEMERTIWAALED